MAMPAPCAGQGSQAEPIVGAGAGVLPQDVLRDVLLRLPAKTICRLRAVCRSWRSFLSDPLFIAAHKSKHPGPLIVSCICDLLGDGGGTINIMDLSGRVVRRMTTSIEDATLLCTRLDLICVTGKKNCHTSGHIIDPAAGHTLALPYKRAHVRAFVSYAFELGQVVSTGEYKALRCVGVDGWSHGSEPMISEVITLGGGAGNRNASWRERPCPPCPVTSASKKSVVVNGVVYFLLDFGSHRFTYNGDRVEPCSVACFDLETEEWMGTLRGPVQVCNFVESANEMCSYSDLYRKLSLVNMNGFLVMVHDSLGCPLDLWFLIDIEKCLWDRKYSIAFQYENLFAQPLLVLEDGRIAIGASDLLRIYDPVSESYTEFQMPGSRLFAIYTGNLLSLNSSFASEATRCTTCGRYFIPEADQHCEECMWHLYWLSVDPDSEYHKARMPLSLGV
ncbi:Protein IQ-DOMAIN 32 [Hordeum vulgare]|nr:Protein IQ-DOMAIN 32 [Hordeum vulgare]